VPLDKDMNMAGERGKHVIETAMEIDIEMERGIKRTFKETIQEFAESHYLLFQPKPFQTVDGQQIYVFGNASIYLSDECVFMKDKKYNSWKPVSLNELIDEAQRMPK